MSQLLPYGIRHNVNLKEWKQIYFYQDLETLIQQLLVDSSDKAAALHGLNSLCGMYKLQKKLSKEVLLKLIDLKNNSQNFHEQYLSIQILSSVVLQSDILLEDVAQDFIITLNHNNEAVFEVVLKKLKSFLQNKAILNEIVRMKVVAHLSQGIGKIKSEKLVNEGCQILSEVIYRTTVAITPQQIATSFSRLLEIAGNVQTVSWADVHPYASSLLQYIFENNLHFILLQKGVFSKILKVFEHCPEVIKRIFLQLAKQKQNLHTLLENQSIDIFRFILIVLPNTNLQMMAVIFEMVEIILQTKNKQYLHSIWYNESIMNCLEEINSFDSKLTLKAIAIYRLLMVNQFYPDFICRVQQKAIACVLIRALYKKNQLETDFRVISQTLKLVSHVMDLERKLLKFAKIETAGFTQNLQESGLGFIFEQIYEKYFGDVKKMAFRILSQNFVKIEGTISSISSLSKKKRAKNVSSTF